MSRIGLLNRLILFVLLLSLALYVVYYNTQVVTLTLAPTWSITASAGFLYLAVFCTGVLVAALFSSVFALRAFFRERRFEYKERQRQLFYAGMVRARGLIASHSWDAGRAEWESLLKRDPTNTIARVELSKCLEGAGQLRSALKTIDEARAADPDNLEVLFRAAELNLAMGNRTAAIDNLALILANNPSLRAALMARDLSEQINRIEDALEYQSQVEKLGGIEGSAIVRCRLEFQRLESNLSSKPEEFEIELRRFVKKREHAPALRKLALITIADGNLEEAAQLLIRAARTDNSIESWREVIDLWIKNQQPDRAMATAKTATKETGGEMRLLTELELIRTELVVGKNEDARDAIRKFPGLAKELELAVPSSIAQQLLTLDGLCASRLGDTRSVTDTLNRLSQSDLSIGENNHDGNSDKSKRAPAPRLSTP